MSKFNRKPSLDLDLIKNLHLMTSEWKNQPDRSSVVIWISVSDPQNCYHSYHTPSPTILHSLPTFLITLLLCCDLLSWHPLQWCVCVCIVVCVYVIILICIIHAVVCISRVDYTYLWCIYVCILYICVFFCVLVLPRACESRAGLVCLLCVKCVCVCRADGYWRSKGFLMRSATWKQQLTCVNLRAFV